MAAESQPFDISTVPELARLADEVRQTRRPRLLRRANVDIAVLTPLPAPRRRTKPAAVADRVAIVARTAGSLGSDIPFHSIDAERAAAEEAMAADAVSLNR